LVLKKIKFAKNQQKLKALHDILIENIEVVNKFFPKIILNLQKILHSNSQTQLKKVENLFLHSTSEKLKIITYVSILLISFVIFSIFLVIMLIFRLERDKKTLAKMVVTDTLTSLYNRVKLNQDIQNKQKQILFIVNIDRFKYYNDFYGVEAGDFLLQKVAKYIKQIFPSNLNPTFYRIGADDFGILIEEKGDIDLEKIAQKLCYSFGEIGFEYKDVEFNISVSVGISKEYPLIETADIMLKYLKKNHKTFGVYNNKLDHKQQIKENLQKAQTLLKAIKTNHLIPYYQPISSNKTGEIVKYEVLARITSKEVIQPIYPFLDIAKENKIYRLITRIIYKKVFQKFENTDICFSLNIALFDLQDNDNMQYLYRLFEKYNEVLPRVTFEILESDAVNDYGLLKNFITFVKSKGAKIAIDDFGSGYSNFVHILNLDVDILKIDGSLIKELDTNKKMQIITKTIVQFAKANNLEVVAEFVHSKEVLQKVKELNIDYSQGFYLGEPKGDIVG
jgi:diguanylate cyclase (GGDEF)-like protein